MRNDLLLMTVYQKVRLNIDEVAEQLNVSVQTLRNWRTQGTCPIKMSGRPLSASINEVARYLDEMEKADE